MRKWQECLSIEKGSKENLDLTYVNSMLQRRGTGRWRGMVMVEYFRKCGSLWKAIQTTPTTNKSQDPDTPTPTSDKKTATSCDRWRHRWLLEKASLAQTRGPVSTWNLTIEHPKKSYNVSLLFYFCSIWKNSNTMLLFSIGFNRKLNSKTVHTKTVLSQPYFFPLWSTSTPVKIWTVLKHCIFMSGLLPARFQFMTAADEASS